MEMPFVPNESKNLEITTDFGSFNRYPIKTHVVMDNDILTDILDTYVKDYVQPDDYVFMSEEIVAYDICIAFSNKFNLIKGIVVSEVLINYDFTCIDFN